MTGTGSLTLTIFSMAYRLRHAQHLTGWPGLRTEARDELMVTYLTDIRGERVVVLQVSWFG